MIPNINISLKRCYILFHYLTNFTTTTITTTFIIVFTTAIIIVITIIIIIIIFTTAILIFTQLTQKSLIKSIFIAS